ncbi:DUF1223 domain-containing protein [Ideonella sp. YS5]|uniref:DUF1223 domain-containing protein n=1 Tax=Ideonella sp. YS5 TaxID=3453714 RepID=UPI003EE8F0E2
MPAAVIELYTSEGCSSCPPADQWIAGLPTDGSVLALAFHVDYWDDLGWADRFGDAAYTARQRQIQSASGARFVYTPQVVANGRDFPGWRQLKPSVWPAGASNALPADAPRLDLRRDGQQLVAEIGPAPGTIRLAGYWALVEDGHASHVGRGENAGRALRHEHVVRRYEPVAAWAAHSATERRWSVPAASAGHSAQAVFVLTDGAGGRPLAARQLALAYAPGC